MNPSEKTRFMSDADRLALEAVATPPVRPAWVNMRLPDNLRFKLGYPKKVGYLPSAEAAASFPRLDGHLADVAAMTDLRNHLLELGWQYVQINENHYAKDPERFHLELRRDRCRITVSGPTLQDVIDGLTERPRPQPDLTGEQFEAARKFARETAERIKAGRRFMCRDCMAVVSTVAVFAYTPGKMVCIDCFNKHQEIVGKDHVVIELAPVANFVKGTPSIRSGMSDKQIQAIEEVVASPIVVTPQVPEEQPARVNPFTKYEKLL